MQESELGNILRTNKIYELSITPVKVNNNYSLGLYIKDSILGVGTLTYYIEEANIFGSLGHQMGNSSNSTGEIFEATVEEIIKPTNSKAGEKKASISSNVIGVIDKNTITGIHGYGSNINVKLMEKINFRLKEKVKLGKAEIWTCIDENTIEKFDIEIIDLEKQNKKDIKGITFKVVDSTLISKAGGIVQGMSGSPIIQDGYLIGAVTHVSIKDSKLGYGIYIEWMFEDMGVEIK